MLSLMQDPSSDESEGGADIELRSPLQLVPRERACDFVAVQLVDGVRLLADLEGRDVSLDEPAWSGPTG